MDGSWLSGFLYIHVWLVIGIVLLNTSKFLEFENHLSDGLRFAHGDK